MNKFVNCYKKGTIIQIHDLGINMCMQVFIKISNKKKQKKKMSNRFEYPHKL